MQLPLQAVFAVLFLFAPRLALTELAPDMANGNAVDRGCTNQTCPIINARFQSAKDEIAQLDDKATTPAFLSDKGDGE
ncbi:hypothetical protein HO133_001022 [Letharia lupina]|uniref:Uncharacterized protein n=1 Tax=Letharia lupina TaxID=560253 RepID=A0A8H6CGS6_9LECA|nr:uncharacterized protein HO133_001022 [Letharia lupina]KAF6222971.1 hypothetical protein HO133_001022 [Letharia lupina]